MSYKLTKSLFIITLVFLVVGFTGCVEDTATPPIEEKEIITPLIEQTNYITVSPKRC